MTREGGVPPLLINPIDFAELYRQQLSREIGTTQAAAGPSGTDTPTTE
jgi:preprotein translocase subunit SecB